MKTSKGFGVVSLIIFAIILSGCAGKAKKVAHQPSEIEKPAIEIEKPAPAVEKPVSAAVVPIILKFSASDTAKYKVVMEGQRKVKWEGTVPDKPAFQSGQNLSRAEIIFTQKIQSVESNGNAVAVITIDGLKYFSSIKESTMLDFDSSRAQDANAPMARLIGQSYTIELTPTGEVGRVIDVNSAEAAVKGTSPAQKAAMRLLETEVIKDRHGTLCLPIDKKRINSNERWKNVKTFSFGLMGPVSYERVYTLKDIDNKKAAVEMTAVPAAEADSQSTSRIAKGFDHKGQYKGDLQFDTENGRIIKYSETLAEEWLAARPSSDVNAPEAEPTALTMIASRFYSIEKID